MLIIDNKTVEMLRLDPKFTQVFEFLTLTEEKKACCGKPAGRVPRYEAIRANIAFLTPERKVQLKGLLGVEKARVFHKGPRGVIWTEL